MNTSTRMLLDHVEEAVRLGRLENAVQILTGPQASDMAAQVAGRRLATDIAEQLQERFQACLRLAAWVPAVSQLRLLRQLFGETLQLQRLRSELQTSVETWVVQQALAGHFDAAETALEAMSQAQLQSVRLRVIYDNILAIRGAQKLVAIGRFAEAEAHLARVAGDPTMIDTQAEIEKIRAVHDKSKELLGNLNRAVADNDWPAVLLVSEQLLQLAARHPLALQWRQRAEAELQNAGKPLNDHPEPTKIMANPKERHPSTHILPNAVASTLKTSTAGALPILWIDGVGGYILCDLDEILIGQAIPGNAVDLGIVGDLSRRAALIRRAGEDFLIQPLQPVFLNDNALERAAVLSDGDSLRLGQRIELHIRKPSRLSATTLLELASAHRWHNPVDGVLCLGQSCVLGPTTSSHVLCPFWSSEVILFKNKNQWMCRSEQPLEVDGKLTRDAVPLLTGQRIQGTDFSMTLS